MHTGCQQDRNRNLEFHAAAVEEIYHQIKNTFFYDCEYITLQRPSEQIKYQV